MAGLTIFRGWGGTIRLPARELVLVHRGDGGHLIVNPAREVWERHELSPTELTQWSFLVAAAGQAMLEQLPQLAGGCINYWEAGNWTLHELAEPVGPKQVESARSVHLHLLGRSRNAKSPAWRWGEAPKFPDFADRLRWAAANKLLTPLECTQIVARVDEILRTRLGLSTEQLEPWSTCPRCGYPHPGSAECAV